MKPADYWRKRSEQVTARQFKKADRYTSDLGREYGRAIQSIQRDIEAFYGRYAINNEMDLAESRKLLSGGELKGFKMSLEEFIDKAKNNADGRWTQQLNNAYYRTRISRFEALKLQIRQQVELLGGSKQNGLSNLLGDVYEDTYYRTLFEIQRGTGIGASFAKVNQAGLEKVLGTEFAGSNWSKRIWADRDKLASELHTKLTQSFIRGDSVDRTIKDVVDRFNVSHSNARRLVQTETAFFTEQATMDSYKESGVVDQYEILATLDGRTSNICQGMDGKVFRLSEKEVGITYPPFHANCRTTTVPYFDDEVDVGERIARDEDGQTYYVPGDITYERWYNDHVINDQSSPLNFSTLAQTSYNNWDKQNVKEFARDVLTQAGLGLQVQRHKIPAHGQCALDTSGEHLRVKTYELNSNDVRSTQYQVKTVFHELFHAKADGLLHDIHDIGFQTWAYYDDVFAESFAHYMVKQIGISDEIMPSYASHLIHTLPRLKALPVFKQANTISDFGRIAYDFRLGSSPTASWSSLIDSLDPKQQVDLSKYSQSYLTYIEKNPENLIDKMLENMPDYRSYRKQMLEDLKRALDAEARNLSGNEKLIFENILILAMNRLGVNEL